MQLPRLKYPTLFRSNLKQRGGAPRGALCAHTDTIHGPGAETGRAPAPLLLNCVIHFKLYTLVLGRQVLSAFLAKSPNRKRNVQREHSTARTAHGHSMSARVSSCINATMITVALTDETRDHLRCTLSTLASLAAESARESGHISPPSAASRYPRPPREPSCRRKQSSSSVAGMCTPWSHCRARTAATDAARSPRHRAWMLKGGGVGEL